VRANSGEWDLHTVVVLPPRHALRNLLASIYPTVPAPLSLALHNVLGSCVARVHRRVDDAHAPDQLGCDPFRIDHGFIGRHIEMQVLLVDPTEGTQRGAERRSCPFTGVAVDLAAAVPVNSVK
jgi:hypothetical protein